MNNINNEQLLMGIIRGDNEEGDYTRKRFNELINNTDINCLDYQQYIKESVSLFKWHFAKTLIEKINSPELNFSVGENNESLLSFSIKNNADFSFIHQILVNKANYYEHEDHPAFHILNKQNINLNDEIIFNTLISYCNNLNVYNKKGQSLLYLAFHPNSFNIKNTEVNAIKSLLSIGADINIQNISNDKNTLLHRLNRMSTSTDNLINLIKFISNYNINYDIRNNSNERAERIIDNFPELKRVHDIEQEKDILSKIDIDLKQNLKKRI